MQKLTVIWIMFCLGLGLTQPSGYMQFCNLEEQYQQCSHEDHDITPLDFVFEHLLNLESIVNLLEGEHEYAGDDHPHLPFQNVETSLSVFPAIPDTQPFDIKGRQPNGHTGVTYAIPRNDGALSCFCADIFRPPILS